MVKGKKVSARYFQLAGSSQTPFYDYGATDISFPVPHISGGWVTLVLDAGAIGPQCPQVSSTPNEELSAAKTISVP